MTEQHNHHCLLTFMGSNWLICACRRHLIDVWRDDGIELTYTTIDIADVDFDAYSEAAVAWDAARERA